MRIFKKLLRVVLIVVLALLAGAYLLPREVEVTRSTTIAATASKIFPFVNSMQMTGKWLPWLDTDPNTDVAFSGPDSGVGNRLEWASDHPQVGRGTQKITASVANKSVVTALDFGDMGTAVARFELDDKGKETEVTWGFATDTGLNPVMRYMGLFMDGWVGPDYEKGLANLKALMEG